MIGLELRTRPVHGEFCDRIEVLCGHQAGHRFVMITANRTGAEFAQPRCDFVGVGTIPYDVTQAHRKIPTVLGGFEDRVESCGVRVQVTENENSHSYFPKSGHEYK